MTRAARSVFIFGLYLVVIGGILIGSPNTGSRGVISTGILPHGGWTGPRQRPVQPR